MGASNIGFRYLQGLNEIFIDLDIHIVDISPKSLELIRKRIISFKNNSVINYYYYNNILDLKEEFDIAIISTTADQRHKK